MRAEFRPRRSVLFAPGVNIRALEKARQLPIDCLILDMEDAVAPAQKQQAREQIVATLAEGGFGWRETVVRVNGLDTPWGQDDVAAIAHSPVDAVLFPKVEDPLHVLEAVKALDSAGVRPDMPLWIMTETPRGVLDIDRILAAHRRLEVVVMGTSDLAKAMRVRHTSGREGLLAGLGLCVTAARAHGVDILDGVYLDLQDEAGYAASCEQGRDMGFDGKTLIHPKQIGPANDAFGVSPQELAHAHAVIAAWEKAQAAGQGVCVVDGRLVENLHVDDARRVLAIYQVIHGEQA